MAQQTIFSTYMTLTDKNIDFVWGNLAWHLSLQYVIPFSDTNFMYEFEV